MMVFPLPILAWSMRCTRTSPLEQFIAGETQPELGFNFMHKLLTALFCFVSAIAFAANPAFGDFNTNRFSLTGNKVDIAGGAVTLIRPDGSFTNFSGSTLADRGVALTNAQRAAISGDMIHFGGAAHLPSGLGFGLGKSNISYWFSPGTLIEKPDGRIFYDQQSGSIPISFNVGGYAILTATNPTTANKTIDLVATGTDAFIEVQAITNLGPAGAAGVHVQNANLTLNVKDKIYSSGYDGIWIEGNSRCVINCPVIMAGDDGLEITGGTNIIRAEYIYGGTNGITVSANARIYAGEIISVNSHNSLGAIGSDVMIDCRRMTGGIFHGNGNVRIVGTKIEGTVKAAGTRLMTLENCSILTSDSFSITNNTASSVNIVGSLNLNGKPVASNVTLVGTNTQDAVELRKLAITSRTNTPAGTTGNIVADVAVGNVRIAAAGTAVTVTDNLVDANSKIFCTLATVDTTAKSAVVVAGAGSFVITLNAASTAEVSINFWIVN